MAIMNKEELINKTCQCLQELQKGNNEIFTELYHTTSGYLYLLLEKWGVNEEEQSDVLQEIYCNISQSINKLEQPQAGLSWIMSIAKHKAMDYLRKKYKEKDRFVYLDATEQAEELNMELENDIFELPENIMESRETQQILKTFIYELPETQRKILEARFFHDMSIKEMAVAFEMNSNTVKTNLSRAKAGFREKVENYQRTTGVRLRSVSIVPVFYLLLEKEIRNAFGKTMSMESLVKPQLFHTTAGQAGSVAGNAAKAGKTVVAYLKEKVVAVSLVVALVGGTVAVKYYFDSNSEPKAVQMAENIQEDKNTEDLKTVEEKNINTKEPTVSKTPTNVPEASSAIAQFYKGVPTNVEKQGDGTYILSFDAGVRERYTITKEEYDKIQVGSTLEYDGRTLYCIHQDGGTYGFVNEEDKEMEWEEINWWPQVYLVSDNYQYQDKIALMYYRFEADSLMDALVNGDRWKEKEQLVVPGNAKFYYATMRPEGCTVIRKEYMKETTLEEFYGSDKKGMGEDFYREMGENYGWWGITLREEDTSWKNLGEVFVTVSESGEVEIYECVAWGDGDAWAWCFEQFCPEYYFENTMRDIGLD